ncbi:MAG TPA: RNA-binding protein [Nitrososphaeraceae archaeon]|nr:RNA-binding protein [Nitrososphaeraceae archaeon]
MHSATCKERLYQSQITHYAMLSNVTSDLEKINDLLKDLEGRRESLIKGTRDVVILCAKGIVSIHNGDNIEAEKMFSQAKDLLANFKNIARTDLAKYLSVPEQELTEGLSLLSIVRSSKIPSMEDIDVDGPSYVLGLLDCIGEIKRIIYDKLRKNKVEDIENLFKIMDDIYGSIYPLAVFDNLVPGLRKKLDVSRHLIEDVRSMMTEEERRRVLMKRIDAFAETPQPFSADDGQQKN